MSTAIKKDDIASLKRCYPKLKRNLLSFSGGTGNKCTSELKRYFKHGGHCPKYIYKTNKVPFVHNYFIPNTIKCLFALNVLIKLNLLHHCKHICDVGSGPGAFTLAYTSLKKNSSLLKDLPTSINMIDCVDEYLISIKQLWAHSRIGRKANVTLSTKRAFIKSGFRNGSLPDLLVFSNSLVEILRNPTLDKNRFLSDILNSNAIILIIDYPYNSTKDILAKFIEETSPKYAIIDNMSPVTSKDHYANIKLGDTSCFIDRISSSANLNSKIDFCMSILVPINNNKLLRSHNMLKYVAAYKEAWEQHDVTLLKSLFCKNATYQEKKNKASFTSINQICEYWVTNSKQQDKVLFKPERISYDKNHINIKWKSRFYRKDLNKWLLLNGTMTLKIRNSKICELTESFSKTSYNEIPSF